VSWLTDIMAKYLPKRGTDLLVPVTGHPQDLEPLAVYDIDPEGWLRGPGVVHVPSARNSALTTPRREPWGIVWHYTATDLGTAKSLAKRIVKTPGPNDRAASWHVLLAADGTVYQSVSFKRGSWHCKEGRLGTHRINASTVGIEMEGHGRPMDFTPALIENATRLVVALVAEYDMRADRVDLQHGNLDPQRRDDAGVHFARYVLPGILEQAYHGRPQPTDAVVTAQLRGQTPPYPQGD